jgi:hypothetical protein
MIGTSSNGLATKWDEMQQALSEEADHIAQVASEMGREAKARAADATDDASAAATKHVAHANSWLSDVVGELLKAFAAAGAALAINGRKTANDVNRSAQSVAQEARKLRLTTEPVQTGPDFMPGISLLAGFGAGAALMYFLDPDEGRRRRNTLRDQLTSWSRHASHVAAGTARDLGNRMQGQMYEARKDVDDIADTQMWSTNPVGEPSTPDTAAADASTTETWGEQPQPSGIGFSSGD